MLDIFPTLVDLLGLPSIPQCETRRQILCTEGRSRLGSYTDVENSFAISQYPRPSLYPEKHSDQPRLDNVRYMGYSIKTNTHRYTEWVGYNTTSFRPYWDQVVAIEMYNHTSDPEEHFNQADNKKFDATKGLLRDLLRKNLLIED